MKTLKNNTLLILALIVSFTFTTSCNSDDDSNEPELVGQDGNPRFNLKFTNEENIDLDLYVRTPNGNVIYYGNDFADEGQLDVDCLCGDCPQGPNENIFWETGTAPTGAYEYWVEYFGDCGTGTSTTSNYTLRVIRNGEVLTTKTGTLNNGQTEIWSHLQE